MKKMKKFFAVILSLAMVLGMSMTAFATEAGTAPVVPLVHFCGLHSMGAGPLLADFAGQRLCRPCDGGARLQQDAVHVGL